MVVGELARLRIDQQRQDDARAWVADCIAGGWEVANGGSESQAVQDCEWRWYASGQP